MEKKVILLTGASSGIGLSAAIQLMNKGFRVYAASRRGSENRTSDNGGEIISTMMDVNREEDIKKVLDEILAQNGHLDAVISNAGNGIAGSIEDTSIEEAKYQFETNFFGAVRVVQACLPIFRKQGYGKIIATSSVAAI
ncbi:MAG: SDR family NAD(P)-dependent oxidoreductase, partial [Paludibacteraceae bacterium]|nr:SDR family NAD(P)-dependent oxidoreductase [Paludibacteraceae bacterium]